MSQDSFYKELGPSELEAAHNNNYDFDAPDSIDIELLYGWLLSCCLMCIDVFGISHVSIQSKNRRVQPREAREGTVGVRCSFTSTQSRHHSLFLPPCSSRTTLETLSCSSRTTLETLSMLFFVPCLLWTVSLFRTPLTQHNQHNTTQHNRCATLRKLKEGQRIQVPIYDFSTHSRSPETEEMYEK